MNDDDRTAPWGPLAQVLFLLGLILFGALGAFALTQVPHPDGERAAEERPVDLGVGF